LPGDEFKGRPMKYRHGIATVTRLTVSLRISAAAHAQVPHIVDDKQ